MSFGFIGSVAMAIVGVAFLLVAVSHQETGTIIKNTGDAFSSALKTSIGNSA